MPSNKAAPEPHRIETDRLGIYVLDNIAGSTTQADDIALSATHPTLNLQRMFEITYIYTCKRNYACKSKS